MPNPLLVRSNTKSIICLRVCGLVLQSTAIWEITFFNSASFATASAVVFLPGSALLPYCGTSFTTVLALKRYMVMSVFSGVSTKMTLSSLSPFPLIRPRILFNALVNNLGSTCDLASAFGSEEAEFVSAGLNRSSSMPKDDRLCSKIQELRWTFALYLAFMVYPSTIDMKGSIYEIPNQC